jgi:Membrane proteins related to metalloendopeptidases
MKFMRLLLTAGILLLLTTLEIHPESSAMEEARALFQAHKYAEAAKAYEAITQAEPDNGSAWYQWGLSLWEMGETTRAIDILQKADPLLAATPLMQAGVRFRVGRAYARLGDREKAFDWIDRAMRSGFPNFQLFSTDPDIGTLKDDARYKKVYEQLEALTKPMVNPLLPIALVTPVRPSPFRAHGKNVLAYELHICSLTQGEMTLQSLEVLNDSGSGERIAFYQGKELNNLIVRPGVSSPPQDLAVMPGGTRLVAFLWVQLDPSGPLPTRIKHRLLFRTVNTGSNVIQPIVEGGKVDVGETAMVIGPPLKGRGWVARWTGNESFHRRGLMSVNGEMTIAQRFATDWNKYSDDWKSVHGEGKRNSDYASYGQEVVSVADAVVKSVKDGVPENDLQLQNLPNTLDLAAGNNVVLDLGKGRYALYAHLQPGHIAVKPGQKVRRGQVLGLVGNSGNATGPHLHFHISSSPVPLAGEGLPFVIDSYELLGWEDQQQANSGEWKPPAEAKKDVHRMEMPLDNAVVWFPA